MYLIYIRFNIIMFRKKNKKNRFDFNKLLLVLGFAVVLLLITYLILSYNNQYTEVIIPIKQVILKG